MAERTRAASARDCGRLLSLARRRISCLRSASMTSVSTESDELAHRGGRARRRAGAGRASVGRADRALPAQFHRRRRAAPLGPAGHPRFRPSEEMRGAGESRTRAIAQGEGRPHRPRVAGRDRRQARRRIPAGRVPDRIGHPVQHERQRGDRQPRDPARGRGDRIEEADPPERRRQSQPVVERRVPDRDAHRLGGGDRGRRCCRR